MMNDLQAAHALLSTAMLDYPAQAVANVVAWLDPLALNREIGDARDFNYDAFEEEDYIARALEICRYCFPEVYTQACQLTWQGADDPTLDRHLVNGINGHLVAPLDDLEQIGYGVPIDAMGVYLDAPEFYADNPDLAGVLADFGVTEETLDRNYDDAQDIAYVLVRHLSQHTEGVYDDLACLLSRLFSVSCNTLVDYTNDDIADMGMEYPDWTLDDIAFVNDMTLEAIGLVASARDALPALESDHELRRALRRNIARLRKVLDKCDRKARSHDRSRLDKCRLRWPERP